MRTRVWAAGALLAALSALSPLLAGCQGDDGDDAPGSGTTTDADCQERIPDSVFDTLRWSPPKAAEETVRGCHREASQGYVEVRDLTGSYDKMCATLDRSGGVGPGTPADWLTGVTACAVEPANAVGQTKVVVQRDSGVTEISVVANTDTDQALVRAAVQELVG